MRIRGRAAGRSFYGNTTGDVSRSHTACSHTTGPDTTSPHSARAATAASLERLPARFLGRPQYDTSCAERDDVQVPESDERRVP